MNSKVALENFYTNKNLVQTKPYFVFDIKI